MPFDDRDSKFERALAQHLRGGPAQANCPDAETLAAYHERNLSLEEMTRWKEHISACEACQEALALVETTEKQLAEDWEGERVPVLESLSAPRVQAANAAERTAQAAASPVAMMRRRPALLRWAIPLGAVAAGVLVFIGIYEQRAQKMAPSSGAVVARREAPLAPSVPLDQLQSKVQQPSEPKDEALTAAELSAPKKEKGVRAAPSSKLEDRERTGAGGGFGSASPNYGALEDKKAMPPSPAPDLRVQSSTNAAVPENAPGIAGALPAAPPPPAPSRGVGSTGGAGYINPAPGRADAKSIPPSATQSVTVESQAVPLNGRNTMMMKQGVANEVVDLTGSATGLILTPDNRVFWKLQPAGAVQLTTDGGKDWKSLETGANEDLTTGFAPSSNVCWIAGRSGTLLMTKDRGTHWSRINTPIAGDLGGVHAADAKHASIWDAARHTSYETSDGGSTWKQTTNE